MHRHFRKYCALTLAGAVMAASVPVPAMGAVEEVPVIAAEEEAVSAETEAVSENAEEIPVEVREEKDPQAETGEDLDYILDRPMTEEERQEQYDMIPDLKTIQEEEVVVEDLPESRLRAGEERAGYPAVYDLRSQGLVTPVKFQTGDTCWSYATLAAAESYLLKNDRTFNTSVDLNEEHLAFTTYNPNLSDPLDNIAGDSNNLVSQDWTDYMNVGGNPLMASTVLSQWKGAAAQSTAVSADTVYENEAILTGFSYTSAKYMKMAITEYGPAAITYRSENQYLNPDTAAYCYAGSKSGVNHAVQVVGWDDTYSKDNFAPASNVTEDGAWIVKNSWGTAAGDQGYNYISYQDPSISQVVVPEFADADKYDHNYQYDGTAGLSNAPEVLSAGGSIANVYEVKGNPSGGEYLNAVGVFLAGVNSRIRIQIYKNVYDDENPTKGQLAYESDVLSKTFQGYQVFDLDEPVLLREGSKYSIVVTAENDIKHYVEETFQNAGSWIGYTAQLDENQSFTRQAGEKSWADNYDSGFCARIKGFTTDTAKKDPYVKATSITVKSSAKIAKGSTAALTASMKPADVTLPLVNWSSSKKSVATVDANGKVTGVNYGTAVITAEAADGSGVKDTCTVTVGYDIAYTLKGGKNHVSNPAVYYNQKVTLKAPSRKGYTFAGWYTDSKYKNKITSIAKTSKKNINLYAKWTKVTVPKVTGVKLVNSSKRTVKVTYKKVPNVKGYQIFYAANAKFTGARRITRLGVYKYITDLKKNGTYYVRVRAVKIDSVGEKVYGAYSTPVKIQVKK